MRKTAFANGNYYHVYNRGVDKREVFSDVPDYERFLIGMHLTNDEQDGLMIQWRDYRKGNPKAQLSEFLKLSFRERRPLVNIVAYCLNPNHYHLIIEQVSDRGVEQFMHKLGTSYTKYFNTKQKRSGALFQGRFKSVHIDSNEYLLYLSAYVNKNNFIHEYSSDDSWRYGSLHDYYGLRNGTLCKKDIILSQFKNIENYKEYMDANALHFKEKKELEKYTLENS